jgi:hypothetical protein
MPATRSMNLSWWLAADHALTTGLRPSPLPHMSDTLIASIKSSYTVAVCFKMILGGQLSIKSFCSILLVRLNLIPCFECCCWCMRFLKWLALHFWCVLLTFELHLLDRVSFATFSAPSRTKFITCGHPNGIWGRFCICSFDIVCSLIMVRRLQVRFPNSIKSCN